MRSSVTSTHPSVLSAPPSFRPPMGSPAQERSEVVVGKGVHHPSVVRRIPNGSALACWHHVRSVIAPARADSGVRHGGVRPGPGDPGGAAGHRAHPSNLVGRGRDRRPAAERARLPRSGPGDGEPRPHHGAPGPPVPTVDGSFAAPHPRRRARGSRRRSRAVAGATVRAGCRARSRRRPGRPPVRRQAPSTIPTCFKISSFSARSTTTTPGR